MTFKKHIILVLSGMLMTGCAHDIEDVMQQERLPLILEPSLSGARVVTRAVGNEFEATDELLCYVRHVDNDGSSVQTRMVTLKNGVPTEPLYWDDFSNSAAAATDLRTTGHGLHTFYGYCYNGGTPSTALVEATGVLGWTTPADQSGEGILKAADLLWSANQAKVTYSHARDAHGTLVIPFTHAMSKFTIVLVADEGFEAGDLDATTVTLSGMNLGGTFTAATSGVTASGTTTVKMYAGEPSVTAQSLPCRAYEAVSVPKVALASGNLLATVQDVDGNDYSILVTDDILTGWAAGIDNGLSMSGVNYKLTVTLNKQTVSFVATLADWTDVSAAGTGKISFTADVKSIDKNNDAAIKSGDSFSLWMSKDNTAFGTAVTTSAFDGSSFVNTPAIYWPNGSDSFYFRALAQKTGSKALDAVTSTDVAQDTDLLWATTSAHKGTEADGQTVHDYAEGAAINPRTGSVPLVFRHVMSAVSITLKTSTDASAVDLTGAKVTLTNLYTAGTVDIATGAVTAGGSKADKAVDETIGYDNLIMVPQTIADNAKMVIALSDGTTYSLQLNECTDGADSPVAEWESGNRYTYTVSLRKEDVRLRALVQDWTAKSGSGNATLDWD